MSEGPASTVLLLLREGGGWTPVWDELPIARKLRGEREELQNMIYFRSRSLGARFGYYKKVRKNPKILKFRNPKTFREKSNNF